MKKNITRVHIKALNHTKNMSYSTCKQKIKLFEKTSMEEICLICSGRIWKTRQTTTKNPRLLHVLTDGCVCCESSWPMGRWPSWEVVWSIWRETMPSSCWMICQQLFPPSFLLGHKSIDQSWYVKSASWLTFRYVHCCQRTDISWVVSCPSIVRQ